MSTVAPMILPVARAATLALGALLGGLDAAEPVAIDTWHDRLLVTAPAASTAIPGAARLLSVSWADRPLHEAAASLAAMSGLNVVCLPGTGDRRLSLTVRGMGLGALVRWMARQTGTCAAYQREALVFAVEPVTEPGVTRFYDVTALTRPVPDFPGPDLAFSTAGTAAAVGPARPAPMGVEDLAEFLRRHVRE